MIGIRFKVTEGAVLIQCQVVFACGVVVAKYGNELAFVWKSELVERIQAVPTDRRHKIKKQMRLQETRCYGRKCQTLWNRKPATTGMA